MINEYAVDKALLNVARQIETDTDFVVAIDGGNYEAAVDETYFKEKVIRAVYDRPISQKSSERQQGIYQLIVCTPISKRKLYHQQQVDLLKPYFPIGLQAGIEFNGQKISVTRTEQSSMFYNEQNTHMQTAFQVRYNVFG